MFSFARSVLTRKTKSHSHRFLFECFAFVETGCRRDRDREREKDQPRPKSKQKVCIFLFVFSPFCLCAQKNESAEEDASWFSWISPIVYAPWNLATYVFSSRSSTPVTPIIPGTAGDLGGDEDED